VNQFEVVVVGGGPAGSSAAHWCARAGLSVAVVDRAEFPRDKPCGGGVTTRAAGVLPGPISEVVEREISGVRFTMKPWTDFSRRAPTPVTYLTQRRRLDALLLQQAEAAGARVYQRAAVRTVEPAGAGFSIRAGASVLRCRYLVAADGANGLTARLAGMRVDRWKGIALEGNAAADPFPERWRDVMGVDFTHVRGGYGWLFPKGDHLNIGVGGWHGVGPTLRQRLQALCKTYGYNPDDLWGVRGHPLPVRRPGSPLQQGNLLLVGDAAGFLDPFTGEGIYAAVWSGRAAARSIVDAETGNPEAVNRYTDDVRKDLLPDLRVSRKLYDLFHLAPWIWTQGVRQERIWRLACRLLSGEQSYAGASAGAGLASSTLSAVYEVLKAVSRSDFGRNPPGTARRPLFFAA